MQDYYHYEYLCPYLSQVHLDKVTCERGCRIIFRSKAEAKGYLKTYCCGDYMSCSIAKMLSKYWEEQDEDL